MSDPSPVQVLGVAEAACGATGGGFGGSWARAASFLIRQALEDAVEHVFSGPLAGVRACPVSTQLICLRREIDPELAGEVHAAWSQLSTACHAHPYELDPTLAELRCWIDVVRRLLAVTG